MQPRGGRRSNALPAGGSKRIDGRRALVCVHRAQNWELREYIDQVFKPPLASRFSLDFKLPALASQCAACLSWPSAAVCAPCVARFAPEIVRCKACALALPVNLATGLRVTPLLCMDCIRHHPPLDGVLTAVDYAYPWSGLITRYKFGERSGWAPFFADLLLKAPGVAQAFEFLRTGDLIIPMPLSAQRLQSRGFNQAWELASALAKKSHSAATPDPHLLLRVKHTRPQTELQREARLANVKAAFQLDPLRLAALAGRRVLLVDDVMTSGASLFTAAEVLRSSGAASVTAVVLARTPQ